MHNYSDAHENTTSIQLDNKIINKLYGLTSDNKGEVKLGTIWNGLEFEESAISFITLFAPALESKKNQNMSPFLK